MRKTTYTTAIAAAIVVLAPLAGAFQGDTATLGDEIGQQDDLFGLRVDGDADATQQYIVGFWKLPRNQHTYQGEPIVDRDGDLGFLVVETDEPVRFQQDAKRDDRVRYVQENHHDYELQYTPDDPLLSDQYGPQITNTKSAWDTTLGSTSVKLGYLDSGITADHEDFVNDRVEGYDYVHDDGTPEDHSGCNYHGSHTSGTGAATTDNGKGIAGMSESTIDMHKIFDSGFFGCGAASTSDIAQALKDHGNEGSHISSNSWGGSSDQALLDAIDYAHEKGVIHVAAAGNDGECTDCVSEPWASRPSKVVIVSCSDSNDDFCSFSSQGPEVDIIAPGNSILSVDGGDLDGYQNMDGTSMSTPHVSGAVALYIAANGDETHSDMETLLGDNADDIGLSAERQGDGRLNSGDLVGSGEGPTAEFTYSCDLLECQFDASNSSDVNDQIESYDWEFGDGTTGTGEIVNHTYDAEGTYTVNLTVTNSSGATDTESKDVTVDDGETTTLLSDGFEDGDLAEWTLSSDDTNLWRASDDCVTPASGSWQMAFSRPASDCDYDVGHAIGTTTSETLDASGASNVTLDFDHFFHVEDYNGEYDVMQVQVSDDGGSNWDVIAQWDSRDHTNDEYTHKSFDISSYASSDLLIRFAFDSVDDLYNDHPGWYIDNVEVVAD